MKNRFKDKIKFNVENGVKTKVIYTAPVKKRICSLILLVGFSILLLITEIYAWFNTQQSVSISNLQARVQVTEELQISLDAVNWSQEINLGTTNTDKDGFLTSASSIWNAYDTGIGNVGVNNVYVLSQNIRPKMTNSLDTGYMNPMSTTGIIATNNKTIKMFSGELQGSKLAEIRQANENEISDENVLENIDALCQEGYYAFDIYLMNTTVSENENDQLQLDANSVVQEILSSADINYGLKNSVRVAFALYNNTADINDSQLSIIEKTYNSEISQVAIWEPNSTSHSEYVKTNNSKMNEIISSGNTTTYAINEIPDSSVINDVYSHDDTCVTEQKTIKTIENCLDFIDMTDTFENAFNIAANKISKIRVYIWLEGQDVDCVNWASHSNGINVTIGLTKGEEKNNFAGKTLYYPEPEGFLPACSFSSGGKLAILPKETMHTSSDLIFEVEEISSNEIVLLEIAGIEVKCILLDNEYGIVTDMETLGYVSASSNIQNCWTNESLSSDSGGTLQLKDDGTYTYTSSENESHSGYYLFKRLQASGIDTYQIGGDDGIDEDEKEINLLYDYANNQITRDGEVFPLNNN